MGIQFTQQRQTALQVVIARARAAILGHSEINREGEEATCPPLLISPSPTHQTGRELSQTRDGPIGRDQAVPIPITARPVELPKPRVLASYPSADEVRGDLSMTKGEARLWAAIHRLAVEGGKERGYEAVPHQIVAHCPAVSLAGVLSYHPDHIARLGRGLERKGLLDCGGHVQKVKGRNMYDGTLWAVLMVPGGQAPRIRPEEWQHNWRPDFEADVEGKTGAAAEMSGLRLRGADYEEKFQVARAWAVSLGEAHNKNHPPLPSSDIPSYAGLKAVVEGLGRLWHLHPSKRARAVGLLASQIAAALTEPDRRRYWCRVIWEALRSEFEGRGGLQVLGAQLSRLEADLREGAPWRNPGAVLAARLKAA